MKWQLAVTLVVRFLRGGSRCSTPHANQSQPHLVHHDRADACLLPRDTDQGFLPEADAAPAGDFWEDMDDVAPYQAKS